MDNYWNHNTAFHEELVADAKIRGGRVLDIGCGDGLLLQRLAPGGRVLIVGLAADKSIMDTVISGLHLLPIRVMGRLHGEMQDIGVRMAAPQESIREIRLMAQEVLPGAITRRRFYYRYSISWDKPLMD